MKFLLAMLSSFILMVSILNAASSVKKNLLLDVQVEFQNKNESLLKVDRFLRLNVYDHMNHVIKAKTIIKSNLPETKVLLVKIMALNTNYVNLHFNLVDYGYKKPGQLIHYQKVILMNGKQSNVMNELGTMSLKAVW